MLLLMVLNVQKQQTQDIVLSATGFINVGVDSQIDDANNRIINTSTGNILSFTNKVQVIWTSLYLQNRRNCYP